MKMFSLWESTGERKPSMGNERGWGGGRERKDGVDKGDLFHTWEDSFNI